MGVSSGRRLTLVVDNDLAFVDELNNQARDREQTEFLILRYPFNADDREEFIRNAGRIKAAFLDFQLDDTGGSNAVDFIEEWRNYLDWNKLEALYWFSGDEHVGRIAIQHANERLPKSVKSGFLRKPFLLADIVAVLEAKFQLHPQWQHFPWPLRVVDRHGQTLLGNAEWKGPLNLPDPKSFIDDQGGFIVETREYFDRLPCDMCSDDKRPVDSSEPNTGLFRLVSFPSPDGQHLLQFAERLDTIEDGAPLTKQVPHIAEALREQGFSRIRFYRYYAVHQYQETTQESTEKRGYLALYYTNTDINNGKGIIPAGQQALFPQEPSLQKIMGVDMEKRREGFEATIQLHKKLENLEFTILDSAEEGQLATPPGAQNYCVVELPLFTYSKDIFELTGSYLMGTLAFDRYAIDLNRFEPITKLEIQRLAPKLKQFCQAVVKALEREITHTIQQNTLKYAELESKITGEFDKPGAVLQKLLALAKEDVGADSGFLAEPCAQGLEITAALLPDNVKSFMHGVVLSYEAKDLPSVRCWHEKVLIAVPDLHKTPEIIEQITRCFRDPKLVWHSQDSTWNPELLVDYQKEIRSQVALPLAAGEDQTAVIVLHSCKPLHFDYEKTDRLKKLIARASWVLAMAVRRSEERRVFLDGILHEINSNLLPLRHALDDLRADEPNRDWQLAYLCSERLGMAAKNLLSITRNVAATRGRCRLGEVLSTLVAMYAPELDTFEQVLHIQPESTDPWWDILLPMGKEWATHVIANLLDNAVKYAGRGATIKISGERQSTVLLLSVCNPGKLSPQELHGAFDGEYRSVQGSGFHVGLASCRKVMTLHGGWIELDCCESHGQSQVIAKLRWPLSVEE